MILNVNAGINIFHYLSGLGSGLFLSSLIYKREIFFDNLINRDTSSTKLQSFFIINIIYSIILKLVSL